LLFALCKNKFLSIAAMHTSAAASSSRSPEKRYCSPTMAGPWHDVDQPTAGAKLRQFPLPGFESQT